LVRKLFSFQGKKRQVRFLSPLEGAELALSALRLLCSPSEEERSDQSGTLPRRAQSIIDVEYRNPLDSTTLARRFNVSREHLSRTFRKETGMTLQSCLTKVRMRAAAELLKQTQLSIQEVAWQCGFKTYSVFYRSFFAYYHASPGAFRAEHPRSTSAR